MKILFLFVGFILHFFALILYIFQFYSSREFLISFIFFISLIWMTLLFTTFMGHNAQIDDLYSKLERLEKGFEKMSKDKYNKTPKDHLKQ